MKFNYLIFAHDMLMPLSGSQMYKKYAQSITLHVHLLQGYLQAHIIFLVNIMFLLYFHCFKSTMLHTESRL